MQEPPNILREALEGGRTAFGIWCSLSSALTTEVVAGAGADWLLIDCEHSPNDLRSVLAQLQALGRFPLEPVVRLPSDDSISIKRFMDAGARSLMIPNVRSPAQAREIVAATQYAPDGIRGFSVAHRANQFGRIGGYHAAARDRQLLVLQIECATGVENAEEIAAVEGVDVLFAGPGDLSTNMGEMGNPAVEAVQAAIEKVARVTARAGKCAGILAPVRSQADRYLEMGFSMVAVGSDLGLLASGSDALIRSFKD